MENLFLTRLCSLAALGSDEQSLLTCQFRTRRSIKAKQVVCRAGEPVEYYPAVLSGWAARCQIMSNGERQITGLLLPGDLAYSSRRATPFASEEIVALSSCKIVSIAKHDLHAAMAKRPQIANAMHAYAAVEYAIANAWLVSLGRRDAFERVAHLLCELQHRLRLDGAVLPNSFSMPLTQGDFADALGLSTVHVHRKFQALRQDRLIKLTSKNIEILDLPLLKLSADFDPSYLEHTSEAAMQAGLS